MRIREWDSADDYIARAKSVLAVIDTYPRQVRRPKARVVREHEWPRGVYEMEVAPQGYRAFNVVYSNGDISFHQFPSHRVTRRLVSGLKHALDRDDPVALVLLKPDPSSSQRP